MEWTDEQRRMLVECAYHMTVVTSHDVSDCIRELHKMVRDYKSGKTDEYGMGIQ